MGGGNASLAVTRPRTMCACGSDVRIRAHDVSWCGRTASRTPVQIASMATHHRCELDTRRPCVQELHQSCVDAGDSYMAGVVDAARLGLGGMPCDIVHDAATAPDAVRRLRAGLPSVTAFEVLEGCRRDLEVFEEQLRALGGPEYPAEQLPEAEAAMVQI